MVLHTAAADSRQPQQASGTSLHAPPPGRLQAPAVGSGQPPSLAALRLHQAIAVLGALAQAAVTLSGWQAASCAGRLQTAAILAATAALAGCTLAAPKFYWRWRLVLLTAARVGLYGIIPSFRRVGVGTALMLDRPPCSGWRGAAADLARVLAGTRLLGLAVGGAAIPLPPAVALATQLVLTALTANGKAYCCTPLLANTLTQQRALRLAASLEVCSLPVLMLLAFMEPAAAVALPGAWPLHARTAAHTLHACKHAAPTTTAAAPAGALPPLEWGHAVCHATLLLLQLALGVLLPTLLSTYWQSPDTQRPGGSSAAPRAPRLHTSASPGLAARLQRMASTATQAAMQVAAAGDVALHAVLQGASSPAARAALVWFLLALCWALSKALAGLPLLL